MQLQERVVVRRVRHREAAADAVRQHEVDVLAGEKLQPLVGGKLEVQDHHIGRGALHFVHAGGQPLDLDVLDRVDLAALDHDVGERAGLAEQRHAGVLFGVGQGVLLVLAVVHLALEQLALAGAAGAVAAAVGDDVTLAQRGIEHGFIVVDGERMVARFDRDPMRHAKYREA